MPGFLITASGVCCSALPASFGALWHYWCGGDGQRVCGEWGADGGRMGYGGCVDFGGYVDCMSYPARDLCAKKMIHV